MAHQMKLRFPESEINSWARKFSFPQDETRLIKLRPDIQKVGYMTKEQLRVVARWKAIRSAGHIEGNEARYVKEITSWSFTANNERSKIEVLTLLKGVSWPTASVILHFFHKGNYPILDFRALWSIGLKVPAQYSFPFWWKYAEFCREVAHRNSVKMRILDRALWQYSKENQKA